MEMEAIKATSLDCLFAKAKEQNRKPTPDEMIYATSGDRQALYDLLSPLFVDMWTDVLIRVQEAFPHKKGDGSANERMFNALRNGILNIGNRQLRQVPNILQNFVIQQMYVQETKRYVVQGSGVHNLPAGVRMPSEKR